MGTGAPSAKFRILIGVAVLLCISALAVSVAGPLGVSHRIQQRADYDPGLRVVTCTMTITGPASSTVQLQWPSSAWQVIGSVEAQNTQTRASKAGVEFDLPAAGTTLTWGFAVRSDAPESTGAVGTEVALIPARMLFPRILGPTATAVDVLESRGLTLPASMKIGAASPLGTVVVGDFASTEALDPGIARWKAEAAAAQDLHAGAEGIRAAMRAGIAEADAGFVFSHGSEEVSFGLLSGSGEVAMLRFLGSRLDLIPVQARIPHLEDWKALGRCVFMTRHQHLVTDAWVFFGVRELWAERFAIRAAAIRGIPTASALAVWQQRRAQWLAVNSHQIAGGPQTAFNSRGLRREAAPFLVEALQASGRPVDIANLTADEVSFPAAWQRLSASAWDRVDDPGNLPTGVSGTTLHLLATSGTKGFLEHCGCAVNQNGGAARRNGVIAEVRARHPEACLVLDLGGLFPNLDRSVVPDLRRKEQAVVGELFDLAAYDAVVLENRDLANGADVLATHAGLQRRVLSANLQPSGAHRPSWAARRDLVRAGVPVSVIGLTLRHCSVCSYEESIFESVWDHYVETAAVTAVAQQVADLPPGERVVVVAGAISLALARQIIDRVPQLTVIVTSIQDRPTLLDEEVQDNERIRYSSHRYRNTLILPVSPQGFWVDYAALEITPRRDGLRVDKAGSNKISLDDKAPESGVARKAITAYYESIVSPKEWQEFPPLFPGNGAGGGGYVGSKSCLSCHQDAYAHWLQHPHSRAVKTLLQRRRHFMPSCMGCHVVGLGEPTGFALGMDGRDPLAGVGCEVCHGGGYDHVAAPSKSNIRRAVESSTCKECHDAKHAPEFDEKVDWYWQKIRHW